MFNTVSDLQAILGQVAKYDLNRKFHSLIDKVTSSQTLWEAWLQVQRNDGACGVDGKSINFYCRENNIDHLLSEIQEELTNDTYQPLAVVRVEIEKEGGGVRPLGIPTVKDRIVQTALKLILEPIFEVDFDFLGFSFRKAWSYKPKLNKFGYVTGVRLARKVIKRAKDKINSITGQGGRKSPVPIQHFVDQINKWIKHWLPYYSYANRKRDIQHIFLNIVLARLVRASVARKSSRKRQSKKWKSWNPQIWYEKYNLINMVAEYYKCRKKLYLKLKCKNTINNWA